MKMAHCNPSPAKRIKVQSDTNPQPQWLLIPSASRTVQDLVKSLLVRLQLPDSFSYELCLDGAPILPNEDVALVRDGEELHLRQRETPYPLPPRPNPLQQPQSLSLSSAPDDVRCDDHSKRKRILTPEGKRRRNARNRKREKRRRLERRESPTKHDPSIPMSHDQLMENHSPRPNTGTDEAKPLAMQECETAVEDENSVLATTKIDDEHEKSGDTTQPSNKEPKMAAVLTDQRAGEANFISQERSCSHVEHEKNEHNNNLDTETMVAGIVSDAVAPRTGNDQALPGCSSRNEPQNVSANATPLSHVAKACLPRVDCERGSVHPSALPTNFSRTDPERNERERCQPLDDQNGTIPVSSAERTSPSSPPTDDKFSKLKSNEQIKTSESHGEAHLLIETANKKKGLRDEDAVPQNDEHNLHVTSSAEGMQPEVKNSESTRDEEVTINISFVNQVASEDRLIANPADDDVEKVANEDRLIANPGDDEVENKCVQHGQALSDNGQKRIRSLNEIEPASASQKNGQKDLKKTKPRWKRQRLQGSDSNQKQPDPLSISVAGTENMEHTPRTGNSKTNNASYRPERQEYPDHGSDVQMSQVERAETRTSPIDVINLVEGEGDHARAFDRLQVAQHSLSSNSSKSNSPQSIVVSPAKPREAILATVNLCTEVAKKRLEADIKETDSTHQIQRAATEETAQVKKSRRKPTIPRRLSKPNADVDLNSVPTTARTNSRQEQASTKELPESLHSPEHVVAVDQDVVKERKELNAVIGREGQQNVRRDLVERSSAGGTPESLGKATGDNKSNLTCKDAKKKQSCLKGGMSTLDALRVARAHQARLMATEKQKEDVDLKNNTEPLGTENMDTTQQVKTDSNVGREGGKVRKKSKRRKRSKSSVRYLNEEQVNKSFFVGHRTETMLPPLELLDLPDGPDELREAVNVPGSLRETSKRSPPETASDGQKDAGVTSKPRDKTEGGLLLANATTSAVLLSDSKSESARPKRGQPEEEPNSRLGYSSRLRNNQSEEQNQRRSGMHREIVAHNPSASQRTTAVSNALCQLGTGDNFREDLFQILRHTSKTLEEVWAKWDDDQ